MAEEKKKKIPLDIYGDLMGYDVVQAREWALEHAQKELRHRHAFLREIPSDIALIWEITSSRSIEEQDCYEVIVACYPDGGELEQKAEWLYHIDFTGKPAPGTPVLKAPLKWQPSAKPLPAPQQVPPPSEPAQVARPSVEAEELLGRGKSKLDKKDYKGAVADFTRALELDPNYPDAYHFRGRAYFRLGRELEARADFYRARKTKEGSTKRSALTALKEWIAFRWPG